MEFVQVITAASVLCAVSPLPEWGVFFVDELKNWTEARSFCRETYMDLVTINRTEDMMVLSSKIYVSSQRQAWIGLYEDKTNWRWSMSDGEMEFRNWSPGEPNNVHLTEFCVATFSTGQWNDLSCDMLKPSVCSSVSGQDVSYVFINIKMTWTEAQSYCRQHHTDLASVTGMSENDRIQQLIPTNVFAWIGLFRDSWKWVDGRNLALSYWRGGEPNGAEENCAIANFDDNGRWDDCPCDWGRPFFCYDAPVSQKVMKLKMVSSSSLDLNDAAVLADLLKQFKQKLMDGDRDSGDIRLSWRTSLKERSSTKTDDQL